MIHVFPPAANTTSISTPAACKTAKADTETATAATACICTTADTAVDAVAAVDAAAGGAVPAPLTTTSVTVSLTSENTTHDNKYVANSRAGNYSSWLLAKLQPFLSICPA